MFTDVTEKIEEITVYKNKIPLSEKINNIIMDLTLWGAGIIIGLLPAIVMTLLYPNDKMAGFNMWLRLLYELEIAYAFLSGTTILTLEQFFIKSVNVKVDKLITPTRAIGLVLEIFFVVLYVAMKPFSINEIEQFLGGSIVDLNKWVIGTSIFLSVILLVVHSLPASKPSEEKGV